MSKAKKFVSKMMNPAAHERKAAQNTRLAEALGRFANEQVDTDKAYLNINGYVMSVRLPY